MAAEFRENLRRLVKARMRLDARVRTNPAEGHFRNASGTYSCHELFENLCVQYQLCIGLAPDEGERFALRYAYAALLREGMRLDGAADHCRSLLERWPGKPSVQQLLAFIEARRGNLHEARALAKVIKSDPQGSAFRVSDDDLLREYYARDDAGGTVARGES